MQTILLPFTQPLIQGVFVRREKRFSVAFICPDKEIYAEDPHVTSMSEEGAGEELWAHTNNTGSMTGLLRSGYPVIVSKASGTHRKLQYSLEMINVSAYKENIHGKLVANPAGWVGVNTLSPNRLLRAAFTAGLLDFAKGYTTFYAEVKTGESRIDACLTGEGLPRLWVECKSVTLVEYGVAAFPDAVSTRGQKHVQHMAELCKNGDRAAFFYCVQRSDGACFAPADYVDPEYAKLFYAGIAAGVEVYPYTITVAPKGLGLGSLLPVQSAPC